MPTKKKPAREAPRDLPAIPKELIDQFVNGPMSAEAIQDAHDFISSVTDAVLEGIDLSGRPGEMKDCLTTGR